MRKIQTEFALGDLADATVRIECGTSSGSGFHFLREDVILTSNHILEAHHASGASIRACTARGDTSSLELLGHSPANGHDFAVLRVAGSLGGNRKVLQPMEVRDLPRGTQVAFSGFPHGVPDLLVHEGLVSGRFGDLGFYIDGNVNPGNSGGPVVHLSGGGVVGIATASRFVGAEDMRAISDECAKLKAHLQTVTPSGVVIQGVSFAQFARLIAESLDLIQRAVDVNANTGIGIGFDIRFALEKCRELGLC